MKNKNLLKKQKPEYDDEFRADLNVEAVRLDPNFADGLSFDECILAMCSIFEMKGVYNTKIAINNSLPIDYENDLKALIVDDDNISELADVMNVYIRHRFGAISICSLDKENTKRIHIILFPEKMYNDLTKGLPALATNRLVVQFENCSSEEMLANSAGEAEEPIPTCC